MSDLILIINQIYSLCSNTFSTYKIYPRTMRNKLSELLIKWMRITIKTGIMHPMEIKIVWLLPTTFCFKKRLLRINMVSKVMTKYLLILILNLCKIGMKNLKKKSINTSIFMSGIKGSKSLTKVTTSNCLKLYLIVFRKLEGFQFHTKGLK